MFPASRLFFVALLGLAAPIASPRADSDGAALSAIAAARGGDWAQAYSQVGQSRDPLAAKIVHWLDYTRSSPGGRFAEIAGFIEENPDWPHQKVLLRRAEEALSGEDDNTAADWLKRHPPVSGAGRARAAEILINRGDVTAGTAALRAAWIDGDFTAAGERALAARFTATLRPEDHQKRLDQLLWDGNAEAARRLLPLVPADYRAAAEVRLALAADAKNAEALLAQVPAALRTDPGIAFDEARWRRKKDSLDAAAQLLLAHPDNPVRPAAWWAERIVVARRLLAGGFNDLAYRLVQQHAAADGNIDAEAEFLCGYIALRHRKDAALAFDHFAHMLARVTTAYAKARAAYWGGRAAATAGKPELAAKWFAAGAEHMSTFYGQLAAHQLGRDAPPRPVPEPRPDATALARFNAEELVRAAQLFFAAGDRNRALVFLLRMAERAKTPLDFAMLASLAESHGRVDQAIAVARRAIDAGMPLMVRGYPITALPEGGIAERPLLLAIVRQESAFAPDALSRAGARGLMQLMPATAAGVARKLEVPFSLDRLTTDGLYNVTLGRSYLERLIDEFGGSYALAIAAYNAGPGRVRQWLREYGDPRGRDITMVDWIEMIPFGETRAYVQRVMENLQIYRGQSGTNAAAFSLVADLAR
ncbi:MAG TPA: lytic transglycosylase domain-containing protein [Stellaceae bacterium]|nr:lytic transglycosylase domain-containing protein [Stellaceae bacterium]